MKHYLGVEIGGTKQQLVVCDELGNVVDRLGERVELKTGAEDIIAWLGDRIPKMLEKHDVCGIGVGFGGPLETATGRVLISVQVPGWKDFELKTWFEEKFRLPTVVVNDTVAGGYGELMLGSGVGSKAFFYTNLGTGIGGALYINGKNWDGVGYGAAYFGNTYAADWTGDVPGAVTRIESLCSGTAIEKRLRTVGYVPADSKLTELCGGKIENLDCRMLGQAADAGDAFALAELDRVGFTFGLGLGNVVSMLGVDTIAIGGGLAHLGEKLIAPMRKYANEYVFISGKDRFKVVQCHLIAENVPIGAALFARDGFKTI